MTFGSGLVVVSDEVLPEESFAQDDGESTRIANLAALYTEYVRCVQMNCE